MGAAKSFKRISVTERGSVSIAPACLKAAAFSYIAASATQS
jgi:hypothetical protein